MPEYAVSSVKLRQLASVAREAGAGLSGIERHLALCLYGSQVSGYASEDSDVDVFLVAKSFKPLIKYFYLREFEPTVALLAVDEKLFKDDMEKASLGEFVSGRFITPHYVLSGRRFVTHLDLKSKERMITELVRNLVLEHRMATTELLIKPEYFLFEKMRRRAALYPPVKYSYSMMLQDPQSQKNLPLMMKSFVAALKSLTDEGLLAETNGAFRISNGFVTGTLKTEAFLTKPVDELERTLRMYLTHSYAGRVNPRVLVEEVFSKIRRTVREHEEGEIPKPDQHLLFLTREGAHSVGEQLDMLEFAQRVYGAASNKIEVDKVGGVLNSTYVMKIPTDDGEEKIFVKKYLNWTDMKWLVAWLWTVGLKNFSVLAKSRMSNEIHFVSRLSELGFNTSKVLHVNWGSRMLFQEFVEACNALDFWRGSRASELEEPTRVTRLLGEQLAKLHNENITLGDCKPENFLLARDDRIFITDLEQAAVGGDKSWDLAELLFYTGHYIRGRKISHYASSLIEGYLRQGKQEEISRARNIRYLRTLFPWTPPWVQSRIKKEIDRKLRA